MAYQPNIPQPTDTLNDSQPDLLGNFQAIQTLIDVNHVDFANAADQGKHKWVTMPFQSSDPGTALGEIALYSKKDGAGVTQLFLENDNDGTVVNITTSGQATSGWTRLPSNILLKWGTVTGIAIQGSGGTPQVANFPTPAGMPVFSAIYSVQVSCGVSTNLDYNQFLQLTGFTTTTFSVYPRQAQGLPLGNTSTVYFFAIGI